MRTVSEREKVRVGYLILSLVWRKSMMLSRPDSSPFTEGYGYAYGQTILSRPHSGARRLLQEDPSLPEVPLQVLVRMAEGDLVVVEYHQSFHGLKSYDTHEQDATAGDGPTHFPMLSCAHALIFVKSAARKRRRGRRLQSHSKRLLAEDIDILQA